MSQLSDVMGVFAISWADVVLDGSPKSPITQMDIGSSIMWSSKAVRLDGPNHIMLLGQGAHRRNVAGKRASHIAARLAGAGRMKPLRQIQDEQEYLRKEGLLSLTDGLQEFIITIVEMGNNKDPILVMHDVMPPPGKELWVLEYRTPKTYHEWQFQPPGAICFTPGTKLATPKGDVVIEQLKAGDLVQTKDNGPQEILWMGYKHMSGARLHALPHLRPIRIAAEALGGRRPTDALLVSPDHNLLLKGVKANELFNADEVFVSARDLVRRPGIDVDLTANGVTYIHILFDRHQILFANGVESESFRPTLRALETLDQSAFEQLMRGCPDLAREPEYYGSGARRKLSQSEAALFLFENAA